MGQRRTEFRIVERKNYRFFTRLNCLYQCCRGEIFVTGGYSWNSIIGKTETLNLTSDNLNSWKTLSNLNIPRYLHACSTVVLKNNNIGALVTGGYSDVYLNSTEIFYPEENR